MYSVREIAVGKGDGAPPTASRHGILVIQWQGARAATHRPNAFGDTKCRNGNAQTYQPVAREVQDSGAGGENGKLGVLVLDQSRLVRGILNVLLALEEVSRRLPETKAKM